jgi:hypothetical protein
MSEKPSKSATQKDEELAALTNRMLNGEAVEPADDQELRAMQQTVSRLKAMTKNPPEGAMQRIEQRLVGEWHKNRSLPDPPLSLWAGFQRFSKFVLGGQPRPLALGLAIILVFLIIFLPFAQFFTPDLEATAGGANGSQLILFVGAVVVVIGLFLYGRRKP